MFLGFGALVNQAAIAMTRNNAYQAAKVVLGPKASQDVLFKAADDFVRFVQPRTNRALQTVEIVHDMNFARIAKAAQSSEEKSLKDQIKEGADSLNIGLNDSLAFGIPNYLLYGAIAVGGFLLWKKKSGGKGFHLFKKKRKSSRRRSTKRTIATSISAPVVGVSPVK